MKKRVHPVTGVLIIAIVLLVLAMVYRQRMEVVSPTPQATITVAPQGPPMPEPSLGFAWMPEPGQKGIPVNRLLPGPPPSRVALIGVKSGDVLLEMNGKKLDLEELDKALDALQKKGTPFALTLVRGGQKITLQAKSFPETLKNVDFHAPVADVVGRPGGGRGR